MRACSLCDQPSDCLSSPVRVIRFLSKTTSAGSIQPLMVRLRIAIVLAPSLRVGHDCDLCQSRIAET